MVIDAAKGIEARTRKLFEVCRLRDIPIVTFINKMDRESRDPFDLLDEIEKTLALDTAPVTWPIGRGRDFVGTYELDTGRVRLLEGDGPKTGAAQTMSIRRARQAHRRCSTSRRSTKSSSWRKKAATSFDLAAFREGHLTPVFFGSALKNFGVGDLLDALGTLRAGAAQPAVRSAHGRRARSAHDGLRVQDPGQHGSQPPRPHRLRAALLRQAQPRHEGEGDPHRQADDAVGAAILLRAGSLAGRRGLCRRRGRHPQSRHAADRRYADRRRGDAVSRRAEFRAGNPAPGASSAIR